MAKSNQLDRDTDSYPPNNSTPMSLEPIIIGSEEASASPVQDVAGACFITLVTLSTLVNSLIIVHFVAKKKYRKSHHMTYLNLAVADLCISVYGVAIRGPAIYEGIKSSTMCLGSLLISSFLTMVNFASIVPLTYDRVVAVLYPYRYNNQSHRKQLKIFISLIWMGPGLVILAINIFTLAEDMTFSNYCNETSYCTFGSWGPIFIYFLAACFYILPLLINVVSYTAIIHELKNRRSGFRNLQISLRAIAVCVVFTMSWVPHFTFFMIWKLRTNPHIMWISQVFLYLNAITDPVLYCFSLSAIKPCIKKMRWRNTGENSSRAIITPVMLRRGAKSPIIVELNPSYKSSST
ncbi:hypothetical protein ACHWQZ_G014051 [Mnemiopsis leidyi]